MIAVLSIDPDAGVFAGMVLGDEHFEESPCGEQLRADVAFALEFQSLRGPGVFFLALSEV